MSIKILVCHNLEITIYNVHIIGDLSTNPLWELYVERKLNNGFVKICQPPAKDARNYPLSSEACKTMRSWQVYTGVVSDSAIGMVIIQHIQPFKWLTKARQHSAAVDIYTLLHLVWIRSPSGHSFQNLMNLTWWTQTEKPEMTMTHKQYNHIQTKQNTHSLLWLHLPSPTTPGDGSSPGMWPCLEASSFACNLAGTGQPGLHHETTRNILQYELASAIKGWWTSSASSSVFSNRGVANAWFLCVNLCKVTTRTHTASQASHCSGKSGWEGVWFFPFPASEFSPFLRTTGHGSFWHTEPRIDLPASSLPFHPMAPTCSTMLIRLTAETA